MTNDATISQAPPVTGIRADRPAAITYAQTRPFLEMDRMEKVVFLLKFAVFVCSFGFAFPRLFSDGIEGTEC
jgi:hypothetical protein